MVLQTEKFYSVENDKIILKMTTGKYDVRYFFVSNKQYFNFFRRGPFQTDME